MKKHDLSIGTAFQVAQRADLHTHLQPVTMHETKAICGAEIGNYPTYSMAARIQADRKVCYLDGSPCLHHVSCKRCLAICTNHSIS